MALTANTCGQGSAHPWEREVLSRAGWARTPGTSGSSFPTCPLLMEGTEVAYKHPARLAINWYSATFPNASAFSSSFKAKARLGEHAWAPARGWKKPLLCKWLPTGSGEGSGSGVLNEPGCIHTTRLGRWCRSPFPCWKPRQTSPSSQKNATS